MMKKSILIILCIFILVPFFALVEKTSHITEGIVVEKYVEPPCFWGPARRVVIIQSIDRYWEIYFQCVPFISPYTQ